MRLAQVYYKNELAGIIQESEEEFEFQYSEEYLSNPLSKPISLTLPLQQEAYKSKILFPFFDGLIPEGWLLTIAISHCKLKSNDRFGLLLSLCKNCIGCVSVIANELES